MPAEDAKDSDQLRYLIQSFVRSFGLLVTRQTPCGHPVSPSHAHALMLLLERDGTTTTQTDLGAVLGIDKSNVARLCSRMEEEGHAQQAPLPGDGRARRLELSARGRRMAEQLRAASRLRFERVLNAVPSSKRAQLLESLALLNEAVVRSAGAPR